MIHYPKYLFHASGESKIVQTAEQHEALGKEWKESPADHTEGSAPALDYAKMTAKDLQTLAADRKILQDSNGVLSKKELVHLLTEADKKASDHAEGSAE